METGIELIARERERQVFKEGWAPKHDEPIANRQGAEDAKK